MKTKLELKVNLCTFVSLPKTMTIILILGIALSSCQTTQNKINDVAAPIHLSEPDYPTPYGKPAIEDIIKVLNRIYSYLESATPCKVINSETKEEIVDFNKLNDARKIEIVGEFRLTSYEWGVTYAGMLLAGNVTGDNKFTEYSYKRLKLIADLAPVFRERLEKDPNNVSPLNQVLRPSVLDDAGSMCASMIKATMTGMSADLRPLIDNYIDFISKKQFRLSNGSFARNRPQPNTMWLDDLYMSVPALAYMGKLTGEREYYDDAVRQVLQFSRIMFNKEKGIYMHGWVQGMEDHPQFHWARANGWAILTLVELLEVLPEDHSGYDSVLMQLRAHVKGIASYQTGSGFWHQLIDRNDTYLETSATAIYTYSIARAINRGYIDKRAYAPMAILGWNAVATKVNDKGQVEGTCVGTAMAFDPAFYYYRPVSVFAAHGYGPVLLAGSEIITLIKNNIIELNINNLQLYLNE